MLKRIPKALSLFLALCLVLCCCSGCALLFSGEKTWSFGARETPDAGGAATAPAQAGQTDAPAPTGSAGPTEPAGNAAAFRETVLASTDACVVTATGFEPDGLWGPTFTILVENKSEKPLMLVAEDVTLNGFMCDPFWMCEVPAGKKANSEMSWSDTALAACGINYLDIVEFTLRAYDVNDYGAPAALLEAVEIQMEHSAPLPPVGEVAYANPYPKQTLVDNGLFLIALDNYNPDDGWAATLALYIENRSDKTLNFTMDDAVVNGFMCSPYWSCEVAPGKKAISAASWTLDLLHKSGVNYLDTLACRLRAYDADDWTADDLYNEPLSLRLSNASSLPPLREMEFAGGFREQTIVDDGLLTLIALDFNPDGDWGPTLVLYCENKTNKTLTLTMEDVSVNDFICPPYWYLEVAPGAKAYSECSWSTPDVEANDIAAFEAAEFTLRAYESDN